ncbi:MAG TPA: MarR family transcriptional regulator [Pusillimonas sp.]|jgi:DNA-binding MarR family transcriptional regulator|nr:MarR family transcriptional regulator [Pusillimonas sp.]MBC43418.1 MarR family transcriptional regulator [Pusillimonas sp.]HBT31868.1 MarR family transcriptional regulator [Pusillimonas sp.]HCN73746.1 MarR family transcriptional regulator [Pusillimonas sp.]|tara:strand:- start:271411 stop:271842 length:432 start_codon:yes stop_codon:yes gene_type:complete
MKYRFTTSFPYLLNRVGVRMGELFSKRLLEYELTLPMYRVMAVLRQEGAQNLGDLSDMVTVEVSTLSRLISSMQRKGLVLRVRPEHNGRTVSITITEKGEKLVDQLMPLAAHFETVGTKTFSADEIKWLKQALIQIHKNLEEI